MKDKVEANGSVVFALPCDYFLLLFRTIPKVKSGVGRDDLDNRMYYPCRNRKRMTKMVQRKKQKKYVLRQLANYLKMSKLLS